MAATRNRLSAAWPSVRRKWWAWPLVLIPTSFVFACLWLTEPLDDGLGGAAELVSPPVVASPVPAEEAPPATEAVAWPTSRTEGMPAKLVLLDALLVAAERLDRVDAYTATFKKQERVRGTLGPVHTLAMKVRHRPFAIYLKFLEPVAGKEVVYAEGRHDNKMIAHGGGFARLLVPRLAVAPDNPIAFADSRHAVTDAGIAKLTQTLIKYRKMDLDDEHAVTILDRVTDDEGRERLRSVHTHPDAADGRPFARVVVLYEPETFLPVSIHSYDFPEPGHVGDLLLAEHYEYHDLKLDAPLTALDFDPANPDYSFHRY